MEELHIWDDSPEELARLSDLLSFGDPVLFMKPRLIQGSLYVGICLHEFKHLDDPAIVEQAPRNRHFEYVPSHRLLGVVVGGGMRGFELDLRYNDYSENFVNLCGSIGRMIAQFPHAHWVMLNPFVGTRFDLRAAGAFLSQLPGYLENLTIDMATGDYDMPVELSLDPIKREFQKMRSLEYVCFVGHNNGFGAVEILGPVIQSLASYPYPLPTRGTGRATTNRRELDFRGPNYRQGRQIPVGSSLPFPALNHLFSPQHLPDITFQDLLIPRDDLLAALHTGIDGGAHGGTLKIDRCEFVGGNGEPVRIQDSLYNLVDTMKAMPRFSSLEIIHTGITPAIAIGVVVHCIGNHRCLKSLLVCDEYLVRTRNHQRHNWSDADKGNLGAIIRQHPTLPQIRVTIGTFLPIAGEIGDPQDPNGLFTYLRDGGSEHVRSLFNPRNPDQIAQEEQSHPRGARRSNRNHGNGGGGRSRRLRHRY